MIYVEERENFMAKRQIDSSIFLEEDDGMCFRQDPFAADNFDNSRSQ